MTCKRCSGLMLVHYDEYVCSACGNVRHKPIYYQTTTMRIQVEETKQRNEAEEKRIQRNMKRRHQRFYTKREKIKNLVRQHGVNGTARLLNKPRSTIGLWTKGVTKKRWNRGKFSKELKIKVAKYAISIGDSVATAKSSEEMFGEKISRQAIDNWRREYKQHQGKGWD